MNSNSIFPFLFETFNGRLSSMRRTVIYDPEDSISCFIGWLGHYLIHQSAKWFNATFSLTPTKDSCFVDIPRSKVSQCSTPGVFVFYFHRFSRTRRTGRVFANPGLNTRLFISTDNIIVWLQGFTFPLFGIKIQHFTGFFNEFGVSWINPRPMKPGANSIFMQPSPNTGIAY